LKKKPERIFIKASENNIGNKEVKKTEVKFCHSDLILPELQRLKLTIGKKNGN